MYKKLGVLLSASVLASAGLVPIISNSNNVQASTVDKVKDNSKLNYDDNEPIDSWMPDKNLQYSILYELKKISLDNDETGLVNLLPENATVNDIKKRDLSYLKELVVGTATENGDGPKEGKTLNIPVSFEGLKYAKNLKTITVFGGQDDARAGLGNKISTLDFSDLKDLPKLKEVFLNAYCFFYKNDLDKINYFLKKGIHVEIEGENFSYLKEPLRLDEKNYKELSIPLQEFINLPDKFYPGLDYSDSYMELDINGYKLEYSVELDRINNNVRFKLLTKDVNYSDIAGKSVSSKEAVGEKPDIDSINYLNNAPQFFISHSYDDLVLGFGLYLFNKVEFAPENQNFSDLTELYNKVKYSISYSGDMFNSQPGNSMKYKDEFNDKTMFGAMDYAHGAKDYNGLIKMMHDSVKKTHESIGSLQVNESKAKELGLDIDQLKSNLAKDSVPYDYGQDNDIEGINKQLDSFASVRAKYNKLVQQGVFDKSDYWTMNK